MFERKIYGAGYGIAAMEREMLQERMVAVEPGSATAPAKTRGSEGGKAWWPDPLDRDVMVALVLSRHPQSAEGVARGLSWKPGVTPQKVEASLKRLKARGLLVARSGQYGLTKGLTRFARGGGMARMTASVAADVVDRLLQERMSGADRQIMLRQLRMKAAAAEKKKKRDDDEDDEGGGTSSGKPRKMGHRTSLYMKKLRKEELEAELERLESTSSPFPEVRARRIEEVRELLAAEAGLMR